MEYINIISKEPLTTTPIWPTFVILVISVCIILTTFIYWYIVKDPDKAFGYLMKVGIGAVIFTAIASSICNVYFKVPTGCYKYEGTINKDKITVSQYEEFIEEYNPTIKDGVYYWEDKVE